MDGDVEAQLRQTLALFRALSGREPTPQEIADARAILADESDD